MPSSKARFAVAKRYTGWDVYPQPEHEQVIALDYDGFWAMTEKGEWFKSPASYVICRDINKDQAESKEWRENNSVGTSY